MMIPSSTLRFSYLARQDAMKKVLALIASVFLLFPQAIRADENIFEQEYEKEKQQEIQKEQKEYLEREVKKVLGGWKGIYFKCSTSPNDDDILNRICQRLRTEIGQLGDLASIHVFARADREIKNLDDLREDANFIDNPQNLEVYVHLRGATSTEVMAIYGEVGAGKIITLGKDELCFSLLKKYPHCDLQKRSGWFELWKKQQIGYGPPDSNLVEAFSNGMKDHLMELVSKVKKYQAVKDQ